MPVSSTISRTVAEPRDHSSRSSCCSNGPSCGVDWGAKIENFVVKRNQNNGQKSALSVTDAGTSVVETIPLAARAAILQNRRLDEFYRHEGKTLHTSCETGREISMCLAVFEMWGSLFLRHGGSRQNFLDIDLGRVFAGVAGRTVGSFLTVSASFFQSFQGQVCE